MLALFVKIPTMYSVYERSAVFFRGFQIFCGSHTATPLPHRGAVLAQQFWGRALPLSAPSSPSPFSPFSETEKNTNFIYRERQKKSNPLGKIRYLWNCSNFFTKFTAFTEEDSGHISCKFHCNIWWHSKIITI